MKDAASHPVAPPELDAGDEPSHAMKNLLIAIGSIVAAVAVFGWAFFLIRNDSLFWIGLIHRQFQVMLALPGAAAAAFILVVLLRQTSGPIRFNGLGFKFEGASGQIVMWVFCFLAMIGAIKVLWVA